MLTGVDGHGGEMRGWAGADKPAAGVFPACMWQEGDCAQQQLLVQLIHLCVLVSPTLVAAAAFLGPERQTVCGPQGAFRAKRRQRRAASKSAGSLLLASLATGALQQIPSRPLAHCSADDMLMSCRHSCATITAASSGHPASRVSTCCSRQRRMIQLGPCESHHGPARGRPGERYRALPSSRCSHTLQGGCMGRP